MRRWTGVVFGLVILLLGAGIQPAPGAVSDLRIDVKEFFLANGMQFLVVERHATPQVACRLSIRAGSALEDTGKTGIAHMLEHMMFKGTKNFGTLDFKRDQELQDKIERAYQTVLEEKRRRHPDLALIKAKLAEMTRLRAEVQKIYVPQAFSSQLARNGAIGVNAFTTRDQTQYVMSVPSDMLEQWFSIVSEQLFEPAWREFYVEKEVVQREWAFRYVNNPQGAAWLDLMATAFKAHPYKNPTIGWKSDMENYNTRDAVEFHHRYYNPTNAVCALVGDVTLNEAKQLAEIYFGRYPKGKRSPEMVTREPVQEGPRKSVRFLKGARTPLVQIGFHGARMGTSDFYALDVLTMVLSQGRGARMDQDIVNQGRAVEAWAYNPDNRYAGMVILGGSPNEPSGLKNADLSDSARRSLYLQACEKLEEILLSEATRLREEWVSARELERVMKLNQYDFLERMRSNEELAGMLATLEVQVGWRYMTTYLEKISMVTPEEVRRVARKYLREENRTSIYIIPGGKPERPPQSYTEIRSLGTSAIKRLTKPRSLRNHSIYPTPEGWKHPLSFAREPKKVHYPEAKRMKVNGATVFYLPDRELPLVDLTLLFGCGAVDVKREKQGLAGVLQGSLIAGGTREYPPKELAMVLDENAVRIDFSVGEEDSVLHVSLMKGDWEKALDLLEEILVRPRFDARVLNGVKERQLTGLRRQGGDAHTVSAREAMIWHFRGHPYGRDPLVGLDTIAGITRGDLKEFLTRYFVPSNMVAAVSGDIDRDEVTQGMGRFLQALPQGRAPERRIGDPPLTPPVLAFIHKPGQVQSQITMILPSVKRTHPDYWKVNLLANIFGGNDSLLYTRLRDDLGLVYSAGFFETYRWKAGLLMGFMGCKGDKTPDAIWETAKLMDDLREGIPENDFDLKRLDALNSFVFNVDSPSELVEIYGRYYLRGEPLDTLERIQDAFLHTTKAELEHLAPRYLNPKRLQIFIVADREIKLGKRGGGEISLEGRLRTLAGQMGLPFKEIPLR